MPWAAKKARARQKKPIVVEAFSPVEGLGVGQAGEAVDGGVQVGVADSGSFASFGGFGFGGSSPVGPPAASGWDASDLLDVQVDHVARETGHDGFADPVGLSGGAGVAPSVQAGSVQPSGHGTRRHHRSTHSQLVADAAGGPLVGTAPVLDEVHRLGTGLGGTVGWGAGVVLKRLGSALAVTGDPLRQRGTGNAGLGGYVGAGATGLDTHHEPVAALRRQRSVTVGHGSGAFSCRKDDSAPPILTAQAPLPP